MAGTPALLLFLAVSSSFWRVLEEPFVNAVVSMYSNEVGEPNGLFWLAMLPSHCDGCSSVDAVEAHVT